jgi:hypothetical protein
MAGLPIRPRAAVRGAALLPYAFRPSVVIRRNAMQKGIFGDSTLWKIIAAVFYGRQIIERVYGRRPERIGRERLGHGQYLSISVTKPLSRRQQKRAGVNLKTLRSQAQADVEAAKRAS